MTILHLYSTTATHYPLRGVLRFDVVCEKWTGGWQHRNRCLLAARKDADCRLPLLGHEDNLGPQDQAAIRLAGEIRRGEGGGGTNLPGDTIGRG